MNHRREKKEPQNQRKVEKGPECDGHFLQYKRRPGRTTAKQRAQIRNRRRAAAKEPAPTESE
jgi:hypothetical protein